MHHGKGDICHCVVVHACNSITKKLRQEDCEFKSVWYALWNPVRNKGEKKKKEKKTLLTGIKRQFLTNPAFSSSYMKNIYWTWRVNRKRPVKESEGMRGFSAVQPGEQAWKPNVQGSSHSFCAMQAHSRLPVLCISYLNTIFSGYPKYWFFFQTPLGFP